MKRIAIVLSTAFICLIPAAAAAQETVQNIYRITARNPEQIKHLEKEGISLFNLQPGKSVDMLAGPDQAERLRQGGLQIDFLARDFYELSGMNPGVKSAPGFHNYEETVQELIRIATDHPDITHLDTVGFSVQGRAICRIKISDHPLLDEDEPPLLFAGAHHGNEVHSIEITLHQINWLTDRYGVDEEVTNWIDSMELWYIPLVNPDGREAMRRANTNNVDLNRNYSVAFTPGGTHGPSAFSEPETRAVRDHAAQYPPIMSLTYHTSGELVLHAWTHTDSLAPDVSAMVYLGGLVSNSILTPTGHYSLLQGGKWYFTEGEYCDYMYVTHHALAFTVEMGLSQAADYSVVPNMQVINLGGMKTMLRQVNKAGVTGRITDAWSGQPVRAAIHVEEIDRLRILPPRLADSLFGRYYRYLAPGDYTFTVSAPGYQSVTRELTVSADSLLHWDIRLEAATGAPLEPMGTDRISGIRPSPFTESTVIGVQLEQAGPVEVTIHNINGIPVKTLASGFLPAGSHDIRWDGADNRGNRLPSGIYFCRFRTGQSTDTKRLLRLD